MSAADMSDQIRQNVVDFFAREAVPTAEDTAKAKRDAQEVLDWLQVNLANHRDSADVARELEDLLFNIGSIRMMWALAPDTDAAEKYLAERNNLLITADSEVKDAIKKAESREHEERTAMFEAVHNLRLAAVRLKSERLNKTADVLEQMKGFFRVEPEAPAKESIRTGAKKAASARRTNSNALKEKIIAECLGHKKDKQWKNPAARTVAPDAFQWNKDAGKPFSWLDEAAAFTAIRRWLDN
ncbi:MAG: hypothetical protein PHG39_02330 [Acidithiobacillus ferrooxidans]|nr:hypothetical protein [Acidithiobacillus ferrooxidans]MDD5003135.1 hypothetical protein [Acidithiobacillus sp.]MDD5379503.1 hypothetical protein [Acidithiobacillus sp.]MDD5576461.1 hypothetical protein [Acidithiobacillus sp.]